MTRELDSYEVALEHLTNRGARIEEALRGADRYLRGRYTEEAPSGGGWRQFLQEEGRPSAAGTACVVMSLAAMGASRYDTQLRAATAFLRSDASVDGGWSKPRYSGRFSLTHITCLALLALSDMGLTGDDPVFLAGLRWLAGAQNSDDGWGAVAGDEQSDVTSTAYAVRTLSRDESTRAMFGPQVESGARWMERQRDASGGWGIRAGETPTLAHTSHGVEALLAAGRPSESLRESRDWLVAELAENALVPWVEHYSFPGEHPDEAVRAMRAERLRWTHLPAERALIALLRLGFDLRDEAVDKLALDLIERHHADGYWSVQAMPDTAPSWAVVEAVKALELYLEKLENGGRVAAFQQAAHDLAERLAEVRSRDEALQAEVDRLTARVAALEAARDAQSALSRLWKALTAPGTLVTLILAATATLIFFYVRYWSSGDAGDRLISISTIVVPALALLEMVRRRGE